MIDDGSVVNLAVFAVVDEAGNEGFTGGVACIHFVVAAFFGQLFTQYLPFLVTVAWSDWFSPAAGRAASTPSCWARSCWSVRLSSG